MRKIHGLSLLALLGTTSAWPMKFSNSISPMKLPVIMSTEQPPSIKYTPPGSMVVSALRMCGDGDVESFASSHPAFDFVPHENAELDVIVGYWVVDESSSDILPSASNWYPIAYKKLPIAESASTLAGSGSFNPISHAASGANVLDLVKSDLVNLWDMADDSYQSNKSYRVFAGAFACVDPDGASDLAAGAYVPTPVETVQSLQRIPSEVNDAMGSVDHGNLLNNNKKIKISLNAAAQRNLGQTSAPTPYKFEIGNQGEELSTSGALYDNYKNILQADYPVAATTVDEYKAAMTALSWHASLSSGITGDKIAYCKAQGATSDKDVKSFNFEAFPMNLTCKNFFSGSDLVNGYNNLFNPDTLPSAVEFKAAQKALAKRFLMAAAYETVQKKLAEGVPSRSGCYTKKSGQDLIGRLVASYPLNFVTTTANPHYAIQANANNHIHPESLFAISDYPNRYSQHEALAIWGQVTPNQGSYNTNDLKAKAILLPLGDKAELNNHKVRPESFGAPININFKVRSVGGSCTIYC